MDSNDGNQKKTDRVVKGGRRIDLSKIDPKYVDDYRDRFKQEDEERARKYESSKRAEVNKGQGPSR